MGKEEIAAIIYFYRLLAAEDLSFVKESEEWKGRSPAPNNM
jgi:hypothetical protein